MAIDYEAEARRFGGVPADQQQIDYETEAAKFGGRPVSAPSGRGALESLLGGTRIGSLSPQPSALQPQTAFTKQAQEDTGLQNYGAGIGAMMSAPYVGAKSIFGNTSAAAEWKKALAGLMATKSGQAGVGTGAAITAAPMALIPGANTIPGAIAQGATFGALMPAESWKERGLNTALSAGAAPLGLKAGSAFQATVNPSMMEGLIAQQAAKAAQTAPRAAALQQAKAAGFRIPPWLANPEDQGTVNSILGGLSGKIKTQQQASIINDPIAYAIAQKEVGLPPSVPITPQNLNSIRDTAGQAYVQLKQFGPVQSTPEFKAALDNLTSEYKTTAADFPNQSIPKVDALIESLTSKDQFNSASLVSLVRRLRYDGFKNRGSPDPEVSALGRIQIGAQNAIENMIEQNLQKAGQGDFLQVFRNARTLIAKTYAIEGALEGGGINARKIPNEPWITGGTKMLAQTAEFFPKAMQKEAQAAGPMVSPWDALSSSLLATAGAASTGNVGGMALGTLPFLRPAVRSMILSRPYQATMVRPRAYPVPTMPESLLNPPDVTRLGMLGGLLAPYLGQ